MLNTLFIPINQVQSIQWQCDQHDKPIVNMCIDETCQLNPLFCVECISVNQSHVNSCHRQILDCQTAMVSMAQNLENIAPQSIFAKYFDYFREFQGKEKEYIDYFYSFIKIQKQKLVEDLERLKEMFNSKFDVLRKDQLEKLDDQVTQYNQNYDTLKNLFNDNLGLKYKQLIKYSNIKTLVKRINASADVLKAGEFIKEIKYDFNFFNTSQKDERIEAFSFKLQELFLLLNSQSVSPPTYQSSLFSQEILSQTKDQCDQLMTKLNKLIEKNIHHYPIKNFNNLIVQQPVSNKSVPTSDQSNPITPIQQTGSVNLLVPFKPRKIEKEDTKYVSTSEEDNCVTAMTLLGDKILLYGLSDNTLRFKNLKEDDLNAEFDCMQMKTWIFTIEVLCLQLDDNGEEAKTKLRKINTRILKKSQNLIEDELAQKSRDVFVVAFGGEFQIFIWKVYISQEPLMKQIEIMTVQEYKPAGLYRCTCIMDCQDGRTFICGDWEGQLFIFDIKQECQLFQLDTQTQIILRLAPLGKSFQGTNKRLKFVSASRCDMELGGVSVWTLRYDENKVKECVMEKRIQISQVAKIVTLKQTPQILVIVDQKNKVFIWDWERNTAIRTFMGGESNILDMVTLETDAGLTLGVINSNTFRFIGETSTTQFPAEDFDCEQCRLYFYSGKVLIYRCHDDCFTMIFPRHIHTCRHDNNNCDTEDRCSLKTCFFFQQMKISQ